MEPLNIFLHCFNIFYQYYKYQFFFLNNINLSFVFYLLPLAFWPSVAGDRCHAKIHKNKIFCKNRNNKVSHQNLKK